MKKDTVECRLEVYKKACLLSSIVWSVYQSLDWKGQKLLGDQLVRSIDSVGANIAEGYGRFHYLDKVRFYYIARGSLTEGFYWIDVASQRGMIGENVSRDLKKEIEIVHMQINALIRSQRARK